MRFISTPFAHGRPMQPPSEKVPRGRHDAAKIAPHVGQPPFESPETGATVG
jgi:hypothetical protein